MKMLAEDIKVKEIKTFKHVLSLETVKTGNILTC